MSARDPDVPRVTVVVPAHDAAATLAETLESLAAQSVADWEAVVVDDGSTDATRAIAARYAAADPRVRVISQAQAGKSVARNAGVAAARGEWLLFLDSDDWIAPAALERFLGAASADVDAVVAGWERVTEDGTRIRDPFRPNVDDLFPTLARFCPFAIHACLVRRSVAEAVGLFDPTLVVGEDWDLWQRVARAGARFVAVDEVLALYRMRPRSAAMDVPRLMEAGRRVIALGHGPDARVRAPDPRYAAGMPATDLPGALLRHVCWPAGILLGAGGDAAALLRDVGDARDPTLDPEDVAHALFWAALLPESTPPSSWVGRWPSAEPRVREFVAALEVASGAPALAARTVRLLERLVLAHASGTGVVCVGAICGASADTDVPLDDVRAASGVERLLVRVTAGGAPLGNVELPVCDGLVPRAVLADAIADQFAWLILERFFARTVYPTLERRSVEGGIELWRGGVRLGAVAAGDLDATALHDAVGWAVLLQEAWGEPAREQAWFYSDAPVVIEAVPPSIDGAALEGAPLAPLAPRDAREARRESRATARSPVVVELSGQLADLSAEGEHADVEFRVGGAAITTVPVPTVGGVLLAQTIRARVNGAAGFELARAVVREALVGQPIDGPPLRERLAASAGRGPSAAAADDVPPWASAAGGPALLLGRHAGPVGSAASRRAALPSAAGGALRLAAALAGDATLDVGDTRGRPARVLYVPEMQRTSTSNGSTVIPAAVESRGEPAIEARDDERPDAGAAVAVVSRELPILRLDAIDPTALESRLRDLRSAGYRSISLDEWRAAAQTSTPLPGRPLVLTFDDPGARFAEVVWPLLRRHGFGAVVFVTTDEMAGERPSGDAPDAGTGLTWDAARRLHGEGVTFGSHSATRLLLTVASPADLVREAARSRAAIARELGTPPTALAYPHGAEDPVVQHLVGAAGYTFGLSLRPAPCTFGDRLLALPRIAATDPAFEALLSRPA